LRIIYGHTELWDENLYHLAFHKGMHTERLPMGQYIRELREVENAYGKAMVD